MPDTETLRRAVADLSSNVTTLAENLRRAEGNIQRNRVIMLFTLFSFALDIILTAAIAFNSWRIEKAQESASVIAQQQIDYASITRENQCALINLFLSLENGATTTPTRPQPELEERRRAYSVIHEIADDLKCPPAT